MVRYHNLPNLEFPEYQINFVLHTFLTIIKDPNQQNMELCINTILTLNPLTWKIWCAPNNASKWQMGFNSAFEGLNIIICNPKFDTKFYRTLKFKENETKNRAALDVYL